MMFWELQLPNERELQSVVASMSAAGWNPAAKWGTRSTCSDPWGNNIMLTGITGKVS
jgi:phage gp16-like protein